MSININLLPWREGWRARQTRQFYSVMLFVLLLGVASGVVVLHVYQQQLAAQQQRNAHISTRIEQLGNEIADVRRYQGDIERLEEQLTLFHMLNNERISTVRLFNDIAASVADGVVYQRLSRSGQRVRLSAVAINERQVSEQLRQIAAIPGLDVPLFSEVASGQDGSLRVFQFEVRQLSPEEAVSMEKAP
ncbi:MAG: fimbrial assembly protein [Gammaproteobacteria bacterium]|uniref:Fimbrial assembly protein n=1 Tax=Vreelandella venusta TaxID=44935 RepID=A0ABX2B5A7_9GAMM|nr:PilN domain-containing protein [Halomonas venusta]AZM94794.1 fimbrial assembly protein [Halomonas venusta]MBR9923862.1 fimbrial assembly protein [Gammaproteobacteria bacterium]NPT29290.1 fimbrial assembly protein [Halomonas venusta]WAM52728.1 PilN domain-containing protein [Halomonas venusta]